MAKLQKSTAVLAASTLLGFFFFSGTVVAAEAAPSAIAIKAADPIGTIGSDDADSDDDSSKESKKEQKQEQKKLEREARDEESVKPSGDKKRKELREKFGSKDSLGLPPIVIHPEDDGEDDDAVGPIVAPKKKPTASPTATATATPTATVDPSITTNTQSLKGGQLATGSATIAGSGANQSVSKSGASEGVANTQSPQQQVGGSSVTQEQVAPIDVKTIDFTGKTPADKFVEAATASIGAMAIGAISLGVVTMVRGKRQQKDLKAEYQYSSTE